MTAARHAHAVPIVVMTFGDTRWRTNHSTTGSSEKLSQVLSGSRLNRSLSQDFVATLELAEKLIVQVVPIGQENQRRILHRRLFDDTLHRRASTSSCRTLACAR